jgi:hypothetical protein
MKSTAYFLVAALLAADQTAAAGEIPNSPWLLRVIDGSSRGADGVRLADVNGDRLPDIATGWEQGGVTRVYLHPGHDRARGSWPAVTAGKSTDVEDAVLADLDGDGAWDVVSCCEGRTRSVVVHWAPASDKAYLDPAGWKSAALPAAQGRMWMYCVPRQVDGRLGPDLIAGAKGEGAVIGWFEAPVDPRDLDGWKWHAVSPAGWIMSLEPIDMDGDGDEDILVTDRKGPLRGCRWLENPGPGEAQKQPWANHWVGGRDRENMFLTLADLDGDRKAEIIVPVKPQVLLCLKRGPRVADPWRETEIPMPANTGSAKGIACGDLDGDGRADLVFSCEGASGGLSGVMWLRQSGDASQPSWTAREMSGPAGIKFDRIELADLDGDGDLDVLTCEEQENKTGLGVFWYENPR